MHTKPAAIYRPLLREAWRLTWERKTLWVFGIFAGVLSTGGVVEVCMRTFREMESTSHLLWQLLHGTFLGAETFGAYVHQLLLLSPTRITVMGTVLIILVLLLLVVAIRSQASLVTGLFASREPFLAETWHEGRHSFWSLVGLHVLTRLLHGLIVILTALPLVLFLSDSTFQHAILFFVLFLIFFPLTLMTSFVSTLTIIHIVRERLGLLEAIHASIRLFMRHWLVTFELSFVLFGVVSLAAIVFITLLLLLAVPYSILVTLALFTSLPSMFMIVFGLGVLLLACLILAFTGGVVSFQHAVWIAFYRRMNHKIQATKLLAKLERLWEKV